MVVIGAWAFAPNIFYWVSSAAGWTEINQPGVWSSIQTLFSGLAFAGLITAILFQSREIKLQKAEIQSTEKMIQVQNDELRLQNDINNLRRSEELFFHLLTLRQNVISVLRVIEDLGDSKTGSECFPVITDGMRSSYGKLPTDWSKVRITPAWRKSEVERLSKSTNHAKKHLRGNLEPYFKNMAYLITLAAKMDWDKKEPEYIPIIHSQLSESEYTVLFYFALRTEPVFQNLYLTLQATSFFEYHFNNDYLINPYHRAIMPARVFKHPPKKNKNQ